MILRFGPGLELLGAIDIAAEGGSGLAPAVHVVVDGQGVHWLAYDPLTAQKLVRIGSDGSILGSTLLGHNPIGIAIAPTGEVFATTRIPLLGTGPIYGAAPDGALQWVNWEAPLAYGNSWSPRWNARGELWVTGGEAVLDGCGWFEARLLQLDPADGSVIRKVELPAIGCPDFHTSIWELAPAPDGTMWVTVNAGDPMTHLLHLDGEQVLAATQIDGGVAGGAHQLWVDGRGDVFTVSSNNPAGAMATKILRFSAADASPVAEYSLGAFVAGFALGATGEVIYATTATADAPVLRLQRLSLVTGQRSTVVLDPLVKPGTGHWIPNGDPTGFVYANVIDRAGDNDGDGFRNGAETAAGSNPFDAASAPPGPKIYLSFVPGTNAIELRIQDPDGIFHPTKGLEPASLRLEAKGAGDVLPLLWPFVSEATLDVDLKGVTIRFGKLPVPNELKVELTARVADRTGWKAWDWQITPPGLIVLEP